MIVERGGEVNDPSNADSGEILTVPERFRLSCGSRRLRLFAVWIIEDHLATLVISGIFTLLLAVLVGTALRLASRRRDSRGGGEAGGDGETG